MVDLVSKSPCAGLLPVSVGGTVLSEVVMDHAWSVAPFDGRVAAVGAVLKKLGLRVPEVGEVVENGNVSAIWFAKGQMLVTGVASLPPLPAAVTDQADGWACVRIDGAARDILARLVPVDLRGDFGVVRTLVGHMSAVVIARADGVIDVMVMRSMARTLAHDLSLAAKGVAARG